MVKCHDEQIGLVFAALADATRRDLLRRIAQGPQSLSSLAQQYRMSLPGLMKHLSILESCGLVRSNKVGRARVAEFQPELLREVHSWLEQYQIFWESGLDRLEDTLNQYQEEERDDR